MSEAPYLLYSDVHFHAWTAFVSENEDRVNTRLAIQIEELRRAYDQLRSEGGNLAICAGDLFHVRGKIKPSVFNPVKEFYRQQAELGVETAILSGNHDLESNNAHDLTSAVTMLRSPNLAVVNETVSVSSDPSIVMVPWHENLDELREVIQKLDEECEPDTDLIIHAPMNDILLNIPNTGLCASEFADTGFKRIFCGHYHNHKQLADNVWSVGAMTHQTWSDVGTKAGFIMVYPDKIKFIASTAPSFMHLPVEHDEGDLIEVDGNYVKADIEDPTPETIKTLREELSGYGAAGVVTRAIIKSKSMRDGKETVSAVDTLEESINNYAEKTFSKKVAAASAEILKEVQSA